MCHVYTFLFYLWEKDIHVNVEWFIMAFRIGRDVYMRILKQFVSKKILFSGYCSFAIFLI